MKKQVQACKEKKCLVAAKLECDFIPSIAYLEWCGIKLDEKKWREKMFNDNQKFNHLLILKKSILTILLSLVSVSTSGSET